LLEMKAKQSKGTRPLPPPVEAALELNNGVEAIAVDFTDERLSAHAARPVSGAGCLTPG